MARKLVRALRTGFWEGHRRRAGAEFTVDAEADEAWFVKVGAAPAGDQAPTQLRDARGPQRRTFVGAMEQIAQKDAAQLAKLTPLPVAEAPAPAEDPGVDGGSAGDDLT